MIEWAAVLAGSLRVGFEGATEETL